MKLIQVNYDCPVEFLFFYSFNDSASGLWKIYKKAIESIDGWYKLFKQKFLHFLISVEKKEVNQLNEIATSDIKLITKKISNTNMGNWFQ